MSDQKKISGLTIFFPAYNDGGTIPSMVLTAQIAARTITDDYEIIVVNDGSQDHTPLVLEELEKQIPQLRVIHHPQNKGYGAALRTGFASATKEWIFYTDGDAQYNPLELGLLVDAAADGVDVVNGYKTARQDPWYRTVLGRLYHHTARILFGFRLRDVDCDFRLFRRSILETIPLTSTTGTIGLEIVKRFQDAGFRFVEVPVSHYFRSYGDSQFFRPRRLFRMAKNLAALWVQLVLRGGRT
jgi:glycosyltransferase involved in cell wall biosynthesis